MKIFRGKLMMEEATCSWCQQGTVAKQVPCRTCKGTGRGPRGGKRGCKQCQGSGTTFDQDQRVTCPQCEGTRKVPETIYDYMPDELWRSLVFKAYRHDRPKTGNEAFLGLDCVYSSNGDVASDDTTLIETVKKTGGHQACKVAKNDGSLCDHVGIFVCQGGYSVRAVWTVEEVLDQIKSERPVGEYLAVAQKIARDGGNGTLGAVRRDL